MEYSRARVKLPPELDCLTPNQLDNLIHDSNLGLADTHIAQRAMIDQLMHIDIAVEMGIDRSTVSRRLRKLTPKVVERAKNNIPQ